MTAKSLPDFKDANSLKESASLLYAAGVILRVALGEVCSVNARVESPVFAGKSGENLVKSFDKVFDYMRKAYESFNDRAASLLESAGNKGVNS